MSANAPQSYYDEIQHVESDVNEVVARQDEAEIASAITEETLTITTGIQELRRYEDIATSLEDVTVVESTIQSATPVDLLLTETIGRLATAGSDLTVQEIIPSLENYHLKQLSMEGFKQTARLLFETIMRKIAEYWERFKNFCTLIVEGVLFIEQINERLQKKRKAMMGNLASEGHILAYREILPLVRGRQLPKSISNVEQGLSLIKGYLSYFTDSYAKGVASVIKNVASKLDSFSSAEQGRLVALDLLKVDTSITRQLPKNLGETIVSDPNFAVGQYRKGADLFGNKSVYARNALAAKQDQMTTLEELEAVQQSTISVLTTSALHKLNEVNLPVKFEAPNNAEKLQSSLDEIDAIVKIIKAYVSDQGKDLKQASERLKNASSRVSNKLRNTDMSDEQKSYYGACMRHNTYLTDAALTPITNLISLAVTSCRNTQKIISKCLQNFEVSA